MADLQIQLDLSAVMAAGNVITSSILPRVHEAVGAIAVQAQTRWADAVMNAPGVWSEEKQRYASSITWTYTGDFSARVSTDYEPAGEIENGRPARDLKRMLDTSLKVRRTTTGKRFLVIPLRHNTPGNSAHAPAMPPAVAGLAAQLVPSRVTQQGMRPAGQVVHLDPAGGMSPALDQPAFASNPATQAPAMVGARTYEWGGRLNRADLRAAGASRAEQERYAGMYRFDTTGGGGVKHSTFLTFRVMHEDSTGWVVPAKPGLQLVPTVINQLRPAAETVLAEALRLDLGL